MKKTEPNKSPGLAKNYPTYVIGKEISLFVTVIKSLVVDFMFNQVLLALGVRASEAFDSSTISSLTGSRSDYLFIP